MNIIKSHNKCKLCETGEGVYTNNDNLFLEIRGNELEMDTVCSCACGQFEDEIKIRFCPMCGRELEELNNVKCK